MTTHTYASSMPLHRSRTNRVLGGVCGGLARWLGWEPTLTRVLYVLLSIFSAGFPGTLVYIILWLAMPIGDD
jgi:phage shock protein C